MFSGTTPFRFALIAALSFGVAACDPDDTNIPDADAGIDAGTDAGNDGGENPDPEPEPEPETDVDVAFKANDLLEVFPPDSHSTFGYPSDDAPFGGAGTSWRFQKSASDAVATKFELYLPFTFEEGAEAPPAIFDEMREALGEFTIGDIAAIEVHSRRNLESSADLTMLIYTTPTGTDDDSGWYKSRLHADFANSRELEAPVGEWNAFSTTRGDNQLQFWDYRNSNVNNGVQPKEGSHFSLNRMKAAPVDPVAADGTTLAPRAYADQTVKYITFMTYSGQGDFDVSIDGITIRLKDGSAVNIDLGGDAVAQQIVRTEISLAEVLAGSPPSTGSSYGAITSENAFGGTGSSLRYQRAANEGGKFELHFPFVVDDANPVSAYWDSFRAILGSFTVGDIAAIRFSTRRNDATTDDISVLVYTTPTDAENDNTWYKSRLHVDLVNAAGLNAPAETWNTYATGSGANQLRFWDYRNKNLASGIRPVGDEFFTLANMQNGPITVANAAGVARDYREQTVKFITFSTYSGAKAQDISLDGFELSLKDGRKLIVDFGD